MRIGGFGCLDTVEIDRFFADAERYAEELRRAEVEWRRARFWRDVSCGW